MTKADNYTLIAERLLQSLETYQSTGIYERPWQIGYPMNVNSGKSYNGGNIIRLMMDARSNEFWGTFKQWQALKYRVRQGSKGSIVISPPTSVSVENESGEKVQYPRPPRAYYVFNGDDVHDDNGNPYPTRGLKSDNDRFEEIDKCLSTVSYTIVADGIAQYRLKADIVNMPDIGLFKSSEHYYATLLHELIHWTGHPSRLDRIYAGMPMEVRAEEELIAEFGSAILCGKFGIDQPMREDHLEYLHAWWSVINNDRDIVKRSVQQANAAVQYLEKLFPSE